MGGEGTIPESQQKRRNWRGGLIPSVQGRGGGIRIISKNNEEEKGSGSPSANFQSAWSSQGKGVSRLLSRSSKRGGRNLRKAERAEKVTY